MMIIPGKIHQATALLWIIIITMVTLPHAEAQVAVRLEMNKAGYLVNEPIVATVYITNHAGRELELKNENGRPWLDFNITSRGRGVPKAHRTDYGMVSIPTGQTVARKVTLNSSYAMSGMGNYVCQVYVNTPGPSRDSSFSSNRAHFTVSSGRVIWNQQVGIPEAPGEIREYELITFSGNRSYELFAHVKSKNRGQEIATIPLGKIISFNKPTCMLDRANNMHTLYQLTPDMFGYSCITPSGIRKFTTYHKRGQAGIPRLVIFASGEVEIAGGVVYDPVAEEAERRRVRNASERPPFIYN